MFKIDPITAEVIRNTLGSIADEMALVILRTSYSPIVRDSMDYSTGVADHNGEVVAHGLTCPMHIGAFQNAMRHLVEDYGDRMNQEDVFIWNDPYGGGGMHLPDVYIVKPIFHDGTLEGYAITLGHQTDVGGIAPGGNSVLAVENYQEGLRIPIIKLYDKGEPVEQVFKFIAKNNRYPDKVAGDMRAQVAACKTAEKSYLELIEKFGAGTLRKYTEYLHDYSERVMREEIKNIPDGTYEFEDHIDGLGNSPEPVKFKVKVTVDNDEVFVDWTGSSPQVKGAINCPIATTWSMSILAIKCVVSGDVPNFAGASRPVKMHAPLGTIVNPKLPGASNARAISGYRMLDALFGALSKAVPNRVIAGSDGGVTFPAIGGVHEGEPYVCTETLSQSWGAMHNRDGLTGMPNPAANLSNQPVEMLEALFPIQIVKYGNVQNSGGPGKYRGAPGFERWYKLLGDEAVLTQRSDRRRHLPYGLEGGYAGTPSLNTVNPENDDTKYHLPTMPMEPVYLQKGDVFRFMSAGTGGHGDPLDRDPQAVLTDAIEELITIDYAQSVYGVAIDLDSETIDQAKTEKLRNELRQKRNGQDADNTYLDMYLEQHFEISDYQIVEDGKIEYDSI